MTDTDTTTTTPGGPLPTTPLAIITAVALTRHPRAQRWYGIRGGGTAKYVQCYLCDAEFGSYAFRWPRTVASYAAQDAHYAWHLAIEELALGGAGTVVGES